MRNENVFAGNELAWPASFATLLPLGAPCSLHHTKPKQKRRTWRSAKLYTHADDNEAASGNGDVVGT